MRAGELELALQIGEGHVDIAHSHFRIDVSEQFHEDGKADAGAKHLRGIGVPELVWNDGYGQVDCIADLMQVIAQLKDERVLAAGTSQEALVGRLGIERAKETQAMDKVTHEGVDGNHSFCLELAQGT